MIRLYKYRPFNGYLEPIIVSQKIWFPARSKLNDPEDLALSLINDVNAEVYRQILLKEAEKESWPSNLIQYNLKKAFTSEGDLTSKAIKKIARSQEVLQKYFDRLGILSLSDREDSSLLWERYGDQEKGVCITFKMELSEHLLRVEYTTPRPQLKLSNLLVGTEPEQEVRKILRTKTAKWSDEAEWRYFVSNGNTEVPFLGTVEAIKVGRRMSDASRQRIIEWIARAERPIELSTFSLTRE